jgi:hypothetical protein
MKTRSHLAAWMALLALVPGPASFAVETNWARISGGLAATTFDPQTFESDFVMQGVRAPNLYIYAAATEPTTADLWVIYYDYADGLDYFGIWEPGVPLPSRIHATTPNLYQIDMGFSSAGVLYVTGFDYTSENYYVGTLDRTTGVVTQIVTLDWDFGWIWSLAFHPVDGTIYFAGLDCSVACDTFIDTLTVPGHQRARVWQHTFGDIEPIEPFFDSAGDLLFSGYTANGSLDYGYFRPTAQGAVKLGSLPTYRSPFGTDTVRFEATSPVAGAPGCVPSTSSACLQHRRFEVEATYDATLLGGSAGAATPSLESDQSLKFSFFEPTNLELFLKVIDGCAYNGHYWVFVSGLTNAGVSLRLTDRVTDAIYTYDNPAGQAFVPRLDIEAFVCSQ